MFVFPNDFEKLPREEDQLECGSSGANTRWREGV